MGSIDQYIDLYLRHRAAFEQDAPEAMNSLRKRALEAIGHNALPEKGAEGYEKTSLEEMFAPDFGVNVNRVAVSADLAASFRCDVPNMSTLLGVCVNDTFYPTKGLQRLPEGVVFASMRTAAQEIPHIFDAYYGTLATLTRPEVALNTLLAQDGVVIYVPDGVTLEQPLQLVNIFSTPAPVLGVRRMLIVLGRGASAQLLVCDHTQPAAKECLSSQVIEIALGADARFEYYDIEESSESTSRVSSLFARQSKGSNLLVNGMTLTCGKTRNDYSIDIDGEGCDTTLAGMAIGTGTMHTDNSSVVRHLAPHCGSRQLFKYVLDDNATGAFEGSILVTPKAPFTEAYQSNKNVLASPTAKMHTRPQLEIYNDDVKCSHGATTGQLDKESLFYMRTRGIPEQEAKNMLMQAFMTDVIDTVRMESLRDRLKHLVEKRLAGAEAMCGECKATCHKVDEDGRD
ncbi:MAG: Fe-S cluster assembly protein SufD [Paramuribaculum sp.]|nr:Fe-S cluster assembly protein SufD [Paramuribaculum sp.]